MGEAADEVRPNDRPDVNIYDQESTANETNYVDEANNTTEIRNNIEHTRAEMSETIDALQERLNPQTLKEQAREQVREQYEEVKSTVRDATIGKAEAMMQNASDTVSETSSSIMDTIRENPIPAALVGIGLGWLFMNWTEFIEPPLLKSELQPSVPDPVHLRRTIIRRPVSRAVLREPARLCQYIRHWRARLQ